VRGMAVFFERLQRAVRLYENNATAYLRTHPLTGERLSDMQNREQAVSYRQMADSPIFSCSRQAACHAGTPAKQSDFEICCEKKFASEGATLAWPGYALFERATGRRPRRNCWQRAS
jgi:predicted Zn-dependent protease